LFLQHAVDDGDSEHLIHVINRIQELLVSMFALYIIMQGKEHQDHDDCETMRKLPLCVEDFKKQLIADIDIHVQGNCMVNGIELELTHNQRVSKEILKAMKEAE
jgi:hypothetical protein